MIKSKLLKPLVVLVLAAAFLLSFGSNMSLSYSSGDYAPAPALMDDIINPQRAPVEIYGHIKYENMTHVIGLTVRIFAADDLSVEYVTTDENGCFYGGLAYTTGQLIKLTFGTDMYVISIPYNQENRLDLGIFIYHID